MNSFSFCNPVRLYFGENQLEKLGAELSQYGKRVLIVYGGGSIRKSGLLDAVKAEIEKAGLMWAEFSGIEPNPRIDSVRRGAQAAKDNQSDVVLAVGGGSVIDAAKYICAGACCDIDPWDFFTKGARVEAALPLVNVVTIASTGSEMDCGSVISNPETNDKLVGVSRLLYPKASFMDPTLTYTVSPYQTACGSADIMSHVMEVYFARVRDLDILDSFMEGILKAVVKYAPIALREPDNYEARANLMYCAPWAMNGFIDGGKNHSFSCHPMEHELSAYYDITHGLGLAILTPRWMRYCLDESNVQRYVQFAVNVFGVSPEGEPMDIAEQGIRRLEEFFYDTLGLQRSFTEIGIGTEHFEAMSVKASRGGLLPGFKPLTPEDIRKIFEMCL